MKINVSKRTLIGAAIAASALALTMPAMAQDYPSRPITLIVPFATGGNTDLTARVFADALSKQLNQPVVVDNRPGAGGTTGGGIVASAAPDGYTLLWSGSSLLSIAPLLYPDLSYDISTAYQPISRIMTHSIVLAVNKDVPANTIEEFVTYAKAKADGINYGSPGVGTIHHLTMELFKAEAGFEAEHIPYQGNGPASTDLIAGTIDAMFMGVPLALPYRDGQELKFLGVTTATADPNMPEVPTFTAAGFPQLEVSQSWYGVLGPAGLPDDVLATLSKASKAAAQTEDVIRVVREQGMETVVEDPADFQEAITSTAETWKRVSEVNNISFK
ncbi:tripartite tricarboxylate transporter substrate binding protein [Chelativorans composti]|uniref:Bug family tripartite tricarboxylate transporter substrate binding protein n=1 Tax=Chelativorans composti TaxID=768533 RepID=A0ABW5DDR5_9HYPH